MLIIFKFNLLNSIEIEFVTIYKIKVLCARLSPVTLLFDLYYVIVLGVSMR